QEHLGDRVMLPLGEVLFRDLDFTDPESGHSCGPPMPARAGSISGGMEGCVCVAAERWPLPWPRPSAGWSSAFRLNSISLSHCALVSNGAVALASSALATLRRACV